MRGLVSLLLSLALTASAAGAWADEATVKKAFQAKFPKARVESVTRTPYLGLYEVVVEGQVFYTDEPFSFLVDGNIIETRNLANVTEERRKKLAAVKFDSLPLEWAFKTVKGDGRRKLAIFSDPDCPFCRRLEEELVKVTNVTLYTFLYPLESLHPAAPEKARRIWCSADPAKAWGDLMLSGTNPRATDKCDNPVDKIVKLGQKLRITGTPTLFFADGQRVPGAIPAAQLEKALDAASR